MSYIFVTFCVSRNVKSIVFTFLLSLNIEPLFFAACTFTPFICVETFITVPLFSVHATTPSSPSASTSIKAADSGFVSSVKIISVAVSGISFSNSFEYDRYPLISNVISFTHNSISLLIAKTTFPFSSTSTFCVYLLSIYHPTPAAFIVLYVPLTISPLGLYTTSFT